MTTFTFNTDQSITIPSKAKYLSGQLYIPTKASGLVLFVHGSGSSRFSKRNQFVAHQLNQANLATLLFDLLTPEEDKIDNVTREYRFDIDLLTSRLVDVTNWCQLQPTLKSLKIGYFGASTGAAAALIAASILQKNVCAVVSRGGRPDLAGDSLRQVSAPTLLIVGELDEIVIQLNLSAMVPMQCIKQLEVIPGATHLFEEAGALEKVSHLAKAWFIKFFT
jgi:pimeloyl-ACP methyl ester carboxylesterase